MSLSDWERNGWLTQTSRNEIRDPLQVVERDLNDSAAHNRDRSSTGFYTLGLLFQVRVA